MVKQLPPYRQTIDEVFASFRTDDNGLTSAEATRRRNTDGLNVLAIKNRESILRKYLRQFQDLMIILLVVSAILAWFLGDTSTAIVLIILIFFNTIIGFLQEYRAEKTMQSLEKLVKPTAEVFRGGKLTQIDSAELVPGDMVRLSEGQTVPADVRIVDDTAFATNDFALTGESNPSRKFSHAIKRDVPLNNRHNIAFMGTTIATGEALGVVIATGMNTELGRIANLSINVPHTKSPLQREIQNIATKVTYAVAFLFVVLLLIAIYNDWALKEAFIFAVGFASSLIPQGLPAEINTNLAQAAAKLSRARALVKKLSSVETLGATSIICTDKTGTLTKNEMTVESIIVGRDKFDVSGTGYEINGEVVGAAKSYILRNHNFFAAGALASNAKILPPDENHLKSYCLGDPTEGALVVLAQKSGFDLDKLEKDLPETREFVFDSARKRMTSVRTLNARESICYVKGAPENVIKYCSRICVDGKVRKITGADREFYLNENEIRAKSALRNLSVAMRIVPSEKVAKMSMEQAEDDLILLGMVSMIDPIREAVPAAMKAARRANIRINIVTGDFALTAEAIARKAGLVGKNDKITVVSGDMLSEVSDDDLTRIAKKGGVIFSRVNPEDKLRIVSLLKIAGEVVAVTGDGINDAPALKRADIGVAMGVTGTDVAKNSAEIVLLDDSFATLVKAIQSGRTIFANIKKATMSCLTSNSAELIINLASLATATALGWPLALGIMQLLTIDLLAELFPIAALGWDKSEGETMREKPRNPKRHILTSRALIDLLICGVIIGGLAFVNYILLFDRAGVAPNSSVESLYWQATTIAYVTIVFCQLANIVQRRSRSGMFTKYQLHNKYFWGAICLSTAAVLAIVYTPINTYFRSAAIAPIDWLFVVAAVATFVFVREMQRILTKNALTK